MKYVYVPVLARVVRLMWHGTSAVNLRSILKQGLVADKKNKKNYDESTSLASSHQGTYVTSSLKLAYEDYAIQHAKIYNSRPVLVLCSISMDQQNVKLDEDYFSDFLSSLYVELLDNPSKSKGERLSYAYDSFTKLLHRSFPTIPEDRLDKLLNSKSLKNYLENIVDTSLEKYSMGDLLKDEPWYNNYISSELGRLSQLIQTVHSPVNFIGSALNLAITSPIKYRGSKRIVAIFKQTSDVVKYIDETVIISQVYGDKKYKRTFIHDWVSSVKRPIEFE